MIHLTILIGKQIILNRTDFEILRVNTISFSLAQDSNKNFTLPGSHLAFVIYSAGLSKK